MTNIKFAMVFPGQGSQSVGMLADISGRYQIVQEVFAEASDVLGYDLWRLCEAGPAETLDKTIHTQPALLAASYAIWKLLEKTEFAKPTMLAGHSLGEYTALVCARSLAFSDAIKLVAARGLYMQEAVQSETGAMAAIIGLDEKTVAMICQEALSHPEEVISPANFNSLGQVVIAGHAAPVSRAIILAKEKGAKLAVLIPVSVPSHCKLMRPAAERLAVLLESITLNKPCIHVINNVDVKYYGTDNAIRDGLTRQLYQPVRWVEIIQAMVEAGITQIIECGPGKVLTGLNKRIDKNLQLFATADLASFETLIDSVAKRSA